MNLEDTHLLTMWSGNCFPDNFTFFARGPFPWRFVEHFL